MATVRLHWDAPTTRASGKPLSPSDIAGFAIEVAVDNGLFTSLIDSPPAVRVRDIPNLGPGDYRFRVSCFDTRNRTGAPATGAVVIPDDTAPSAVINLTVEILPAIVTVAS